MNLLTYLNISVVPLFGKQHGVLIVLKLVKQLTKGQEILFRFSKSTTERVNQRLDKIGEDSVVGLDSSKEFDIQVSSQVERLQYFRTNF